MMIAAEIKAQLEVAMPSARVIVEGEDQHFRATIVWEAFEGKTAVAQHRWVYAALGDAMREAIHALTIRTLTPEQAAQDDA